MKKLNKIKTAFLGIVMVLCYNQLVAQASFANNNYIPGRYLGWNTTNGVNPLFFRTNGRNRMEMNGTVNYGVNGYPATSKNGYLNYSSSNPLAKNSWKEIL